MTDRPARALIVGVGSFPQGASLDDEPRLAEPAWPPLAFAEERVKGLASVLTDLGYELVGGGPVIDPDRDALFRSVQGAWEETTEAGSLILHVLSHGKVADGSGKLHVVPACGRIGIQTDVESWLASIEERSTGAPPTLFLLDACRAGKIGRLPWQRAADEETRAWVVAATSPEDDAYFGWFTEAVTTVLRRLRRGELGVDPSEPYLRFEALARSIQIALDELTDAASGRRQFVTTTLINPARPIPWVPFVPNPNYRGDRLAVRVAGLEQGLQPFLDDFDEVFDAEHFFIRSGGETVAAGSRCHFSGRRTQLRTLSLWLDSEEASGLQVVTGSPGIGKSALLGALVCAAHPRMVEVVPQVRARLDPASRPSVHEHLAAVHARQRGLGEIASSLARQLGLGGLKGSAGWTAAALIQAIAEMPRPPVIVLDALDEATDPGEVMHVLLLPLATTRNRLGTMHACRLLVGVRGWEEFAPLRDLAAAGGALINLDEVPREVLRQDLENYLLDLLADEPAFWAAGRRPVREALASGIATGLTAVFPDAGAGSAGVVTGEAPEWGEFIVAQLFARHVLATSAGDLDVDVASVLASSVPRTLPDVLELELQQRSNATAVRPVMATLAHAKGEGMPADVLAMLTPAFMPSAAGEEPSSCNMEEVQSALADMRFYLRHTVDTDGITLYRLFHQGLADYLRLRPSRWAVLE